jgi:hypothetical protein
MNLERLRTMIRPTTKPGTRVVCINASTSSLKLNQIYTIAFIDKSIVDDAYVAILEENRGRYWTKRFRYLQTEPDEFGEIEDDE